MKIDVVGIRLVKEREIDYDKSIHQPIDTVNFVLEEMQDLDREMCMTLNLDAKQQEKTQSIDEEKDLELDEFEK